CRSSSVIVQMIAERFERLPELDRKIFTYGPMCLGGNVALVGLIGNRRFISNLPMAVLPFLTTVCDLNYLTCVLIRGALVSAVGAGVYPILLALPCNQVCATCLSRSRVMYNTAPMPENGNVLHFWMNITQPILRKMGVVIVLQVFFGTYLSSRHFDSYLKLLQLSTSGDKELED
uniref:Transmembrane protein 126A n=1 Tax=Hucho hucho TaxID=62062 RepID=A0A4W5K5L3_9TELE